LHDAFGDDTPDTECTSMLKEMIHEW